MQRVYEEDSKCCGCGACMYRCPKKAIYMKNNQDGFMFPVIDKQKCIDCGLCRKICAFSVQVKNPPQKMPLAFAAVNMNKDMLYESTSGGVFSAIAHHFLGNGGAVCGARMSITGNQAVIEHILITKQEDGLRSLQGSKYVQSNLFNCMEEMETLLKQKRPVLFSGTPCQVDVVKKMFLNYKDYLYTIDIICHGVPSAEFFNDYLSHFRKKNHVDIDEFLFRSKKYGWGLQGITKTKTGSEFPIDPLNSSYYNFFLNGDIYRESCYACPYACLNRPGDITIGDYWGIEKYDKALLKENGGNFSTNEGVSCLLINTPKGKTMIQEHGSCLEQAEIMIQNLLHINRQLKEPAKKTSKRKLIFQLYRIGGYSSVEMLYACWQQIRKCKNLLRRLKRQN